jgi:hypothetical protein
MIDLRQSEKDPSEVATAGETTGHDFAADWHPYFHRWRQPLTT